METSLAWFELGAGALLALYPVYTKPLSTRCQQAILLTVSLGCSVSMARRSQWPLLWFALSYGLITLSTFFVPMLSVVVAAVTTYGALLCPVLPWTLASWTLAVLLALGTLVSRDFVRNWQVWLLPALAGVLVAEGLPQDAEFSWSLWLAVCVVSAGLQLNRLKKNFETLQKEADLYKDNHYKMFEEGFGNSAVLAACKGDQEQIERVLFGAGLY